MSLSPSPDVVYDTFLMGEQEPRVSAAPGPQRPEFGQPARAAQPAPMFDDGADLPIFSGTPIPAIERPFVPEDQSMKQAMLPGMPGIDYEAVLAKDKELRRRRRASVVLPPEGDIFVIAPARAQPAEVATQASAPSTRE